MMNGKVNEWSDSVKKKVWKKGKINPDYSPDVLRWDTHGNIMMWSEYGRIDSKFGWDIDLIDPVMEEDIENLQPFNKWCRTD
ncbi:MAG: hypothetical protein KAR19_05255 [Bacteroidales bacterium]|nr:hypothetical protein [Bacteroidales bacterium]